MRITVSQARRLKALVKRIDAASQDYAFRGAMNSEDEAVAIENYTKAWDKFRKYVRGLTDNDKSISWRD